MGLEGGVEDDEKNLSAPPRLPPLLLRRVCMCGSGLSEPKEGAGERFRKSATRSTNSQIGRRQETLDLRLQLTCAAETVVVLFLFLVFHRG